jgi:copper homeostasis protein (lipoprotein)
MPFVRFIMLVGLCRAPISSLCLLLGALWGPAVVGESLPPGWPGPGTVSFSGELPCSECAGIRLTVTLRPAHSFGLRETYLAGGDGLDQHLYDQGRWHIDDGAGQLVLAGGTTDPWRFRIQSAQQLRLVDGDRPAPHDGGEHSLRRTAEPASFDDSFRMRGMYAYMADAGLFEECLSGERFAVAQSGDNASLERAYLRYRTEPGEPLLVSLYGHYAMRPKMEGDGQQEMLVVDRFQHLHPGTVCRAVLHARPLENTQWRLADLGGQAVRSDGDHEPPNLVLDAQQRRALGNGSCNRFFGPYQREGRGLGIGPLATTRRACETGMDMEQRFLSALNAADGYRITGDELVLFRRDLPLARFYAERLD